MRTHKFFLLCIDSDGFELEEFAGKVHHFEPVLFTLRPPFECQGYTNILISLRHHFQLKQVY